MIIYETINLINGKKYIGMDKNNDSNYLGSGKGILRAIKKYGKQNFQKTIIEHCTSIEHLIEREIYWIAHYNAVKDRQYYNMKPGGNGGDCPQLHTPEFIQKMKTINSENRMHNKHHSEQAKQKQRKAAEGRWTLEWFIERYGQKDGAQKWKDRNAKLSEDRKGEKNPFYGKSFKYEEHPMYTDINPDELLSLIKQGLGGVLLARHFNTTTPTIYRKIDHFWGCKIGDLYDRHKIIT